MVGGAQELFGFGSLVWGPEHRPAEWVGAVEQDRQQQPVVDAAQIEQWPLLVKPQPHGAEKTRAPRMRQRQPVAALLEQRRVRACFLGARDKPSLIALKRDTIVVIAAIVAPDAAAIRPRSPRRWTNHSSGVIEHGPMTIAVR